MAKESRSLQNLPEAERHAFIRKNLRLGHGAPEHLVFKVAETQDERSQAFRVLHDAYVSENLMDPHPSQMRINKYHALPTTAIVIAKDTRTGDVVATASIIRDSRLTLPLDSVFPIHAIRQKYKNIAEVSALAIRPDYRGTPALMLWPFIRYIIRYLKNTMRVDAYVLGVNPGYHDLYAGILCFTKLEGMTLDNYGFVKNAPVSAYLSVISETEAIYKEVYGHMPGRANFYSYAIESELNPDQHQFPQSRFPLLQSGIFLPDDFQHFFLSATNVWQSLSHDERREIQNYYPLETYAQVFWGPNVDLAPNMRANRVLARLEGAIENSGALGANVEVMDFSVFGLRLESKEALPDCFQVHVRLGTEQAARLTGRVIWKQEQTYGVNIVAIDDPWSAFILETGKMFGMDPKILEAKFQKFSQRRTSQAA